LETGANPPSRWEPSEGSQTLPSGRARAWHDRDDLLLALGAAAWLVALIVWWPAGLSYSDEVGYLGQAKLFLEGRIRWMPGAPGIWNPTPHGVVAQYPLLLPLLLAPLFRLSPSAIFLVGVVPALALTWLVSRILKSWGSSPCWALIFLAHPTMVILARTEMSDLLLTSLAVGSWWALKHRRALPAILLLAATMAARPTGVPIAAAIIAGEVFETWWRAGLSLGNLSQAKRQIAIGAIGFTFGMVLVLTSNVLTTGGVRFGYNYRPGIPSFSASYILRTGPAYLRALLANPPLLLLGILPLWRRRLITPLVVIASFGTMMLFYVWVDWAPTWFETMVLSERLILPIVAFLMIGYAAGLSQLAERLRLTKVCKVLLVIAPAAIAFKIGSRHHSWQQPMVAARTAAAELVQKVGSNELGLTYESSKAALMFPGKTVWVGKNTPQPAVFLCATHGNSYRTIAAGIFDEDSCDPPGYRKVETLNGFVLMLRDDVAAPR